MEKKNGRVYIVQAKQSKGTVHVAGWVHEVRDLGKLKFLLLRDRTGLLQITIKKGKAPEQLLALNFHREEVLAITGEIAHNKIAPDGVELIPEKIELLATVEKKLPVDPSDMVPAEVEVRLDHRYLDIRRKKIQSIFEPLVRFADQEKADYPDGTSLGIGLYIAREILRAHGGTIKVDSSEALGTVFSVRLPRNPRSAE